MPSKDLGTVPVNATSAGTFIERTCIIIRFSTGDIALTNHPCPSVSLDLGAGVKTYNAIQLTLTGDGVARWYRQYDITLGEINDSTSDGRSVSSILIGNLAAENNFQDRQITKWSNSPGIRRTKVDIFSVHFDPTTNAYLGSYLLFPGEFDGGDFGEVAQLTVKFRDTPWANVLLQKPTAHCVYLRNYKGEDCAFAGAEPAGQVTCSGSIGDCILRGNQARYGGFEKIPKPGLHITYPK